MKNIIKIFTNKRRLSYIAFGMLFAFINMLVIPQTALALSEEQKRLINKNILYYNYDPCVIDTGSGTSPLAPGLGDPDAAIFPNLNPEAMEKAINQYIKDTKPTSKLNDRGGLIVAGANKSNINPLLVVAIAQKESSLADPNDYNVRHANNSFGRTATESQPNHQGEKLWYKWSSVKASVDHAAPENKNAIGGGDIAAYIRDRYPEAIEKGDIQAFFNEYAPEYENDTAKYISDVGNTIDKLIELTNKIGGDNTSVPAPAEDEESSGGAASGDCSCSPSSTLAGANNAEKIFNFYINNGFTPEQAAGFVGNYFQESGWNPSIVNSIGATGIAQWLGGRKTALINYAKSKGKSYTSLEIQLQFSLEELKGAENAAHAAIQGVEGSGATAVEQVTVIIRKKYERPGEAEANDPARIKKALEYYEKYNGGSAPVGTASSGGEGCAPGGSGDTTGEFIWPLDKKWPVTSCYGFAARGRLHSGIDIGAAHGTSIAASDGGTVTFAGTASGFGETIVIKHDNGFTTLYAHLKSGSMVVNRGDKVDQSQKIGEVNNTGSSFGDHLHFNIQKNDQPAYAPDGSDTEDPLKHLPKDGRTISGGDCT